MQMRLARRLEIPAPLKQLGVHRRLLRGRKIEHGAQRTARLFQQTLFAALVVTELLRVRLRFARQRQTLRLLAQGADRASIELGHVAHALADRNRRLLSDGQNDLGIAQIEQPALAGLFQYVLG